MKPTLYLKQTRQIIQTIKFKQLLIGLFCFFAFSSSTAQNMTAEEIMTELELKAGTVIDFETTITGQLIDFSGAALDIEIFLQFLREENIGRAEFIQPDILADNFIVLDKDTVYNYLFLTNQVTVYDATDPNAFGGLIPEASDSDIDLFLGLDPDRLFKGWKGTVIDYIEADEDSPVGNLYQLRFDNDFDTTTEVGYIVAWVVDEAWYPYKLEIYVPDTEGAVASLQFNNLVQDQDLDPLDVAYVPDDAEIIDER